MSMFIAALIMGGIGSVHCIGMCGPLALSLPVVSNDHSSRFVSTLLYNTGRVVTYALLGAVFGLVGMSFAIFGYQQWLSLILGSLIIIFIILPKHHPVLKNNRVVLHFFEKIRSSLATLFSRKNYHSLFFIGLLNGLLPCGLVYIAIAAAVSTASIFKSSLFMAGFGLGTLPVMWSIAFFGSLVSMNMRRNIKKCYPYVMFLVGVLLVIRGLGLEIPYMSPVIGHQQKIVQCHD
ncbi:MAG: sulfite exporter TauE/SafE family protein [Ferruginibacter sp.]